MQQPHLVNNLALQRAAHMSSNGIAGGGTNIPAPALPNMDLPSFSWPHFSLFEIVIIFFAVWVGFELYRRYQKQKKRFENTGQAKKSKNLIDIIYDFITDRREYYNDNLQYLE